MNMQNKKGKIVVISGPSGVGKSTIRKEVLNRLDNVCRIVSVTTRLQAKNEINGKDYWFVTKQQFQEKLAAGQLLEYAEVFGNLYGTPKDKVDEALDAGKNVILEIDVQGGKKIKNLYPDAVMIFIMPPARKDLVERMTGRARDDSQSAAKRLSGADAEIAAAKQYYEHIVVNDDLEEAINNVIQIIQQARSLEVDCGERKK
jgi:guanylate kinase